MRGGGGRGGCVRPVCSHTCRRVPLHAHVCVGGAASSCRPVGMPVPRCSSAVLSTQHSSDMQSFARKIHVCDLSRVASVGAPCKPAAPPLAGRSAHAHKTSVPARPSPAPEHPPMVTLFPMMVGLGWPSMLWRATWTMALSWMLVLLPTWMLFTSPARVWGAGVGGCWETHALSVGHCWQRKSVCCVLAHLPRGCCPLRLLAAAAPAPDHAA